MAPFRLFFVPKMLIMRCITPLFAPRLAENVLIFDFNPKFKHPLSFDSFSFKNQRMHKLFTTKVGRNMSVGMF